MNSIQKRSVQIYLPASTRSSSTCTRGTKHSHNWRGYFLSPFESPHRVKLNILTNHLLFTVHF